MARFDSSSSSASSESADRSTLWPRAVGVPQVGSAAATSGAATENKGQHRDTRDHMHSDDHGESDDQARMGNHSIASQRRARQTTRLVTGAHHHNSPGPAATGTRRASSGQGDAPRMPQRTMAPRTIEHPPTAYPDFRALSNAEAAEARLPRTLFFDRLESPSFATRRPAWETSCYNVSPPPDLAHSRLVRRTQRRRPPVLADEAAASSSEDSLHPAQEPTAQGIGASRQTCDLGTTFWGSHPMLRTDNVLEAHARPPFPRRHWCRGPIELNYDHQGFVDISMPELPPEPRCNKRLSDQVPSFHPHRQPSHPFHVNVSPVRLYTSGALRKTKGPQMFPVRADQVAPYPVKFWIPAGFDYPAQGREGHFRSTFWRHNELLWFLGYFGTHPFVLNTPQCLQLMGYTDEWVVQRNVTSQLKNILSADDYKRYRLEHLAGKPDTRTDVRTGTLSPPGDFVPPITLFDSSSAMRHWDVATANMVIGWMHLNVARYDLAVEVHVGWPAARFSRANLQSRPDHRRLTPGNPRIVPPASAGWEAWPPRVPWSWIHVSPLTSPVTSDAPHHDPTRAVPSRGISHQPRLEAHSPPPSPRVQSSTPAQSPSESPSQDSQTHAHAMTSRPPYEPWAFRGVIENARRPGQIARARQEQARKAAERSSAAAASSSRPMQQNASSPAPDRVSTGSAADPETQTGDDSSRLRNIAYTGARTLAEIEREHAESPALAPRGKTLAEIEKEHADAPPLAPLGKTLAEIEKEHAENSALAPRGKTLAEIEKEYGDDSAWYTRPAGDSTTPKTKPASTATKHSMPASAKVSKIRKYNARRTKTNRTSEPLIEWVADAQMTSAHAGVESANSGAMLPSPGVSPRVSLPASFNIPMQVDNELDCDTTVEEPQPPPLRKRGLARRVTAQSISSKAAPSGGEQSQPKVIRQTLFAYRDTAGGPFVGVKFCTVAEAEAINSSDDQQRRALLEPGDYICVRTNVSSAYSSMIDSLFYARRDGTFRRLLDHSAPADERSMHYAWLNGGILQVYDELVAQDGSVPVQMQQPPRTRTFSSALWRNQYLGMGPEVEVEMYMYRQAMQQSLETTGAGQSTRLSDLQAAQMLNDFVAGR